MPVLALIVGTYVAWVTAKGELGKYLKLATTKNPANAQTSAPAPPASSVTGQNVTGAYTSGAAV